MRRCWHFVIFLSLWQRLEVECVDPTTTDRRGGGKLEKEQGFININFGECLGTEVNRHTDVGKRIEMNTI